MKSIKKSINRYAVNVSRRRFLKNLSFSVAGAVTASGCATLGKVKNVETGKMKYRPLGQTGMLVSEVALGGHYNGIGWKEKGSDQQSLRNEVIKEAYKKGINFFDSNEVSESEKIGIALEVNRIKRNKIFLSADTNAYDGVGKKSAQEIIDDAINEVDRHLTALKTSYVDIFRYTTWGNEFNEMGLAAGVEAFKILKKEGKAKHFAISNHNPKDLFRMTDEIPELEILYIPYSYIATKAEEVFPVASKKGIGVICIKPFVRGTYFNLENIELAKKGGDALARLFREEDKSPEELQQITKQSLALANLKFILANENISTVIPGMETVEEVRENVKASFEGKITESDIALLDNIWNNGEGERHINEMCSGNYYFLRQWRS